MLNKNQLLYSLNDLLNICKLAGYEFQQYEIPKYQMVEFRMIDNEIVLSSFLEDIQFDNYLVEISSILNSINIELNSRHILKVFHFDKIVNCFNYHDDIVMKTKLPENQYFSFENIYYHLEKRNKKTKQTKVKDFSGKYPFITESEIICDNKWICTYYEIPSAVLQIFKLKLIRNPRHCKIIKK